MKKYLQYFWAVVRHKWFVGIECFKMGLYWRGIIHDWTKFLPDEFVPYANTFYGDWDMNDWRFIEAWNKHQKRHDHHWQFWLYTADNPERLWGIDRFEKPENREEIAIVKPDGHTYLSYTRHVSETFEVVTALSHQLLNTPEPLNMSRKARMEMLADWRGAGRAYGNPDTKAWYMQRIDLMRARLHAETWWWIEAQLGI